VPPSTKKGKGRARQSLAPSATEGDDGSEGAIVSELELEYDENASIKESDDSGSEFQVSEEDSVEVEQQDEEYVAKPRKFPRKQSLLAIDQDFLEDENDDEIMLDAAIQESLQTARFDEAASNGAGPSLRPIVSSNSAAALRAAAAERRLARANRDIDLDDLEYALLTENEEESPDEALFTIKAKKKCATIRDTTSTRFMSISERRKLNREKRKFDTAANRRGTRKEELAMIRELGRPLTLVRLITAS
jgi:DNA repair protein RAD16